MEMNSLLLLMLISVHAETPLFADKGIDFLGQHGHETSNFKQFSENPYL